MNAAFPKVFLAAVLISSALTSSACRDFGDTGTAHISERRETIRTYPFADPDPVPIFARSPMWGRGARLYPYFFFNTFTGTATDSPWTVVRLENPHIAVSVLPEIGGKVRGAVDKKTGLEFLYTNHVVKFREIALRGPWTSGGIEFNFGIVGHAPSTATPVDYLLRREPDGGVSCVVGTMDLPSRTRWSVTISLPPDKAYFETRSSWFNPTPYNQSYYAWMCAAVRTADDLKYVFPGRRHIGHDYDVPLEPWPVDREGRDLSWYRNNAFGGPKSYFTVGTYEDFFGGWYENSDFGFGRWALYNDMPGKKIWIWDHSPSGEIWVDLLTDSDGQYTEPQSGRLLNQSDHEFFKPLVADRWREIWFPYRGIGPLAKASPHAVLSVEARAGGLHLGLFALQAVNEDLVVTKSGRTVHRERVRLKTAETWMKTVSGDFGTDTVVSLGDKLVFHGDPAALDIGRPLKFSLPGGVTAESRFMEGTRLEKERDPAGALNAYLSCLDREPHHVPALTRIAEIFCRRGEYEKALGYASKALEISMYDPAANFAYGTISRRVGHIIDAKETYGWAARSMEYRSAAYSRLAAISLLERNLDLSREYAERAIESNAHNSAAWEILAAGRRKAADIDGARRAQRRLLEIEPLNHQARFERYLIDPRESRLEEFRDMIRNEFPHETYLEMAVQYTDMGCPEDAVTLLKLAPRHPTLLVWLSWLLRDTDSAQSAVLLEKAFSLSPQLVFPFREESIPVFEWAAERRPDDWKPRYYLGLILWGKDRLEEASRLFDLCDASDYAPLFVSRGQLRADTDPARALADFEKAVKLDEGAWRNRQALIHHLRSFGRHRDALEAARTAVERFPGVSPLQAELVKSLMNLGRYGEAAGVLETLHILPYEGAREVHSLYVRTYIQLGLAAMRSGRWAEAVERLDASKEYPERLGTGAPFHPDVRLQDYLAALCFDRMGLKDKAEERRRAVYEYTLARGHDQTTHNYFGALVLEYYGESENAAALPRRSPPSADILSVLRLF
ncbi:MAG: DUF5107 domain-containing protein [Acidobacteriota bacterium]|nr:DUF5107 domain-containing protein [Acidobacteriota bacterium]